MNMTKRRKPKTLSYESRPPHLDSRDERFKRGKLKNKKLRI
jgi:hypothetical protein